MRSAAPCRDEVSQAAVQRGEIIQKLDVAVLERGGDGTGALAAHRDRLVC